MTSGNLNGMDANILRTKFATIHFFVPEKKAFLHEPNGLSDEIYGTNGDFTKYSSRWAKY